MKFTNSFGETITPAQYFTGIAFQLAGGFILLTLGYVATVFFFSF
jgi:hypothetical protein